MIVNYESEIESLRDKLTNAEKFGEIEVARLEDLAKEERMQFQSVIKLLETQLNENNNANEQQLNANELLAVQQDFEELKDQFQLAVETLKQRDMNIHMLESHCQELQAAQSAHHTAFVINKLEAKITALTNENHRLGQTLLDRVR